jgi:cell division protein ZapA
MGQVRLSLNGRSYSLVCGDGEEERVRALAEHVQDRVEGIVSEFGQTGEARLLLMAALLIADELYDCRAERELASSGAAAAALREAAERSRPVQSLTQTGPGALEAVDIAASVRSDGKATRSSQAG